MKKYDKWTWDEKIIINIFLCYYNESQKDNKWATYLKRFKDLKVDWWVQPHAGNIFGLAYQSILNTNDMDDANSIAKYIFNEFDEDILIVLSKQCVRNYEPVGLNNDEGFTECGRFFDKLVKGRKKGIFVI